MNDPNEPGLFDKSIHKERIALQLATGGTHIRVRAVEENPDEYHTYYVDIDSLAKGKTNTIVTDTYLLHLEWVSQEEKPT